MDPKYYHKYLGWNARIDAVQAALLRVKLPHLETWIDMRQAAAQRYSELIEEQQIHDFVQRPTIRPGRRHTFNQYVVRIAHGERDDVVKHLKMDRIGCEIYYPLPLHRQESLQYLGYREGDFPAAEEACKSVLALPMFPELTEDQQHRVVQSLAGYVRKRSRLAA